MTDNFERFKDFINQTEGLPDKDPKGTAYYYYVIEIMRRGKDNPDMPAANVHFKNYYIYSWEDYNKFEKEIKILCEVLNMRAYISVNRKELKRIAINTVAEMTRRIAEGDYKRIYKVFESCSGKYKERNKNYWIIDLDDEVPSSNYVKRIKEIVNSCQSQFETNIIMDMPTKSGVHILTHPFNKHEYEKKWNNEFGSKLNNNDDFELDNNGDLLHKKPDIKENHLTLLYENL